MGLSYGAIAVYSYLMHIEDRNTFPLYAGHTAPQSGSGLFQR